MLLRLGCRCGSIQRGGMMSGLPSWPIRISQSPWSITGVVVPAEQTAVGQAGVAEVSGPPVDVVLLAPAGRPVAAGQHASPAAQRAGPPRGRGEGAGAATQVHQLAGAADDRGQDLLIAGPPPQLARGQPVPGVEHGLAGGAGEQVPLDEHGQVRGHPTLGGSLPAGQEDPPRFGQRLRRPGRRRTRVGGTALGRVSARTARPPPACRA